jgi:hypothetical protein
MYSGTLVSTGVGRFRASLLRTETYYCTACLLYSLLLDYVKPCPLNYRYK